MKTRSRSFLLLLGVGVLLLAITLAWCMAPVRAAPASPATLEQNAAIQAAEQLLFYSGQDQKVYLPRVVR